MGPTVAGVGGSRRRAGARSRQLPVVRWLQVGAAATGAGLALMAAPGLAAADDGAVTGVDASRGPAAASEAAAGDSGEAAGDSEAAAGDAAGDSGAGASTRHGGEVEVGDAVVDEIAEEPGHQDGGASAEPEATAEEADGVGVLSSSAPAVASGDGAAGGGWQRGSDGVGEVVSDIGSDAEASAVRSLVESPAASSEAAGGSTGASSGTTGVDVADAVAVAGGSPGRVAFAAAAATGASYPAAVLAPVTWRSIVVEGLSWTLGLSDPFVPIPDSLAPDWLAGLWTGVRKLRYTFFNSVPSLHPTEPVEDISDPLVFTGSLGGYDADGDVLTYTVVDPPSQGTVVIAQDGTWTYTIAEELADVPGEYSFTVRVSDDSAANPRHFHPFAGLTDLLARWGVIPSPTTKTIEFQYLPALGGGGGSSAPVLGQFVIPWDLTPHYQLPAPAPIGICFGGGNSTGVNQACAPGGTVYVTTGQRTTAGGDKYYDFGGGYPQGNQWWNEAVITELNSYMPSLQNNYQGVFYDIETFDAQSFDVESMFSAFEGSFALAKSLGLKVIVSTSYSAPYDTSQLVSPAVPIQQTDELWKMILGSHNVDYFSPQLYGDGTTATIEPTSGSSITFSTWTSTISGSGKIITLLKAWSADALANQIAAMETACGSIGQEFCATGYLLWGST
ncbi:MAG: Ig-like domain-containing protein [Mycolicibacterium sp.]|uniref:Ig-like domain-containing protein n=1 Tax=Mycolicibacterium sp. TaxID=2320850 RepID=UPI003D144168